MRWRLEVAYDGTAFSGFAVQEGQRTIAGALAAALQRSCRMAEPPVIAVAGRTDRGVHALANVIHVDLADPAGTKRDGSPQDGPGLCHSLNRQLGGEIIVTSAAVVAGDFSARYDATERRYRYLIANGPVPDPLLAHSAWHISDELDLRSMTQAAYSLIGEHDFRAFCRRVKGTSAETPIRRRVHDVGFSEDRTKLYYDGRIGRLIRFDIAANAFCHQMVRSIVGELVAIGKGLHNAADIVTLLHQDNREGAADPAPPGGLCLVGVTY